MPVSCALSRGWFMVSDVDAHNELVSMPVRGRNTHKCKITINDVPVSINIKLQNTLVMLNAFFTKLCG